MRLAGVRLGQIFGFKFRLSRLDFGNFGPEFA